jgi:phosphoribosylaminoimidazole-succinocarboxamide synthase
MEKKEALYEGKAKIIYATDKADELLVYYKDDATAGNGAKKGTIADKGIMNNKMTAFFFKLLEKQGIKTHYVSMPSEREMLVKKLDMIPLEVVMRNVAAGSLAERLGLEEGTVLSKPIVELYYKSDKLGDPMLNHYHIQACPVLLTVIYADKQPCGGRNSRSDGKICAAENSRSMIFDLAIALSI